MYRIGWIAPLFLLTACSVGAIFRQGAGLIAGELAKQGAPPQPWKSVPTGHERAPQPPLTLVPARADFTFIDHSDDRHYWIWLYHDLSQGGVLDDRVYVQEPGRFIRPATFEETSFALRHYDRVWRHRTVAGKLDYLRQEGEERMAITPRLLDELIHLKGYAVEELALNSLELEAQIRAMGAVGEDSERRRFIAIRLDETNYELNRARAELAQLRGHKRAIFSLR